MFFKKVNLICVCGRRLRNFKIEFQFMDFINKWVFEYYSYLMFFSFCHYSALLHQIWFLSLGITPTYKPNIFCYIYFFCLVQFIVFVEFSLTLFSHLNSKIGCFINLLSNMRLILTKLLGFAIYDKKKNLIY